MALTAFKRRWGVPTALTTYGIYVATLLTPMQAAAQEDELPPTAIPVDPGMAQTEQPPPEEPEFGLDSTPFDEVPDATEPDLIDPDAIEPPALETPKEVGNPDELQLPDLRVPPAAFGLPTGQDKSGVSSQAISVPSGAGTIKGMEESFSAQLSTGIATFTVPFALPSARGKAQPSLSLSYSSSSGFGNAGVGWSLGAPFIARQTDRGVPTYDDQGNYHDNQDRFVFNGGQELVPICVVDSSLGCTDPRGFGTGALTPTSGTHPAGEDENGATIDSGFVSSAEAIPENEQMPVWAAGWQYFRPRVEGSFLRFFWSPDHKTWRVQSKSGVTMELGVPLDETAYTNALERNPIDANEVYRWCLVRQYDTYGNANLASGAPKPNNVVQYRYFQEGGLSYLSDIYDTPPAADPTGADLSEYAHHTRIHYEPRTDPTSSYRSGWRIEQNLRASRVDVASKPFTGASGAARTMVRRYELQYDSAYHASLLSQVQVEGRCGGTAGAGSAPVEDGSEDISPSTGCRRLPPMKFGYSHVDGFTTTGSAQGSTLSGYEPFDERIIDIADSPDNSVDEELTDLFDINSDSLPDVLVTAGELFDGKHGVFFNSPGGNPSQFGFPDTIAVDGAFGANAATISLRNLNVVPLDLDADATINLLHMPKVRRYAIYTPSQVGTAWRWQGRGVATADGLDAKIDFGRDAPEIRVVDVNFDGLVDVVITAGTEMQTFFALGRYPGGDGQFGSAARTGPNTASLSNDPVTACVPWAGTPVRFSDPDIKLGDMNGDGITDIVRLRRGDIIYWPGRGNGFWGTGDRSDCLAGAFGPGREIRMGDSPVYSDIEGNSLRLDDVNGDGLSDLVQVRFGDVDIWLNVDGEEWTERHIIEGTPPSPSFANRVRLVDVNGSGTRDILWGDGGRYRYIDLQGAEQPRLLVSVDNGLGKTTDIEYSTTAFEMLAAERDGVPWEKKMPTVAHVVKTVTESDNITVAGKPPGLYVTEYAYRDPVFEGRQREFRGFSETTVRRIGDVNSPTDITTSRFLLGECVDETDGSPCPIETRDQDNPREALKGLPFVSEVRDEAGTFLYTEHTGYRLRELYRGLDGRAVRHAYEVGSQRFAYDTAPFTPGADTRNVTTVQLETAAGQVTTDTATDLQIQSTSGLARIDMGYAVDFYGNRTDAVAFGCTGESACSSADEVITNVTLPARASSSEPTGWLWRIAESGVLGSAHSAPSMRNRTFVTYNEQGDPVVTDAELEGTLPLVRSHEDLTIAGVSYDASRAPPFASIQPMHNVPVNRAAYDAFGNLTREVAPNGRCRDVAYENDYQQLTTSETIYTGGLNPAPADPEPDGSLLDPNCSTGIPLVTQATYDRGFELATVTTDFQNQDTTIAYDEFGRLSLLTRPSPHVGEPGSAPSIVVEYLLPPERGTHHSIVKTLTQDSFDHDEGDPETGVGYLESYTYVDGFGRTVVSINEADPDPTTGRDDGDYIVSGLVDYDSKSALQRKYLEFFTDSLPETFDFGRVPEAPFGRQRYDAFGRHAQTIDLDGTITLHSAYHALSTDLYDAADLEPGPHEGTFASERRDGHGRTVEVTERYDDGGLEGRQVLTQYLQTNEPEIITRRRVDSSGNPTADPVVDRWMVYDSMGRMVLNVEPNTTDQYTGWTTNQTTRETLPAWRYAYNDFGDLVGTSDARGCGVDYTYDGAGRLTSEDYLPCLGTVTTCANATGPCHETYTQPSHDVTSSLTPPKPASGTTGFEILYLYDEASPAGLPTTMQPPTTAAADPNVDGIDFGTPDFLKGRLVAVWDRGSNTWTNYDGRGRAIQIAAQVMKPGATDAALATRYAPRWYQRDFAYDALDRETAATTGVSKQSSNLQGFSVGSSLSITLQRSIANDESVVLTNYSGRGTVSSVGGSYTPSPSTESTSPSLVRGVDRDADGHINELTYGDRATTEMAFAYDDRRRLRTLQTFRAFLSDWDNPPPEYLPAPAPNPSVPETFQLLLQDDEYTYDSVNNPVEVRDWRIPEEWPDRHKPVAKKIEYDDLYRVTRVDYEYSGGDDDWISPYDAENNGNPDPRRAKPSPHIDFSKAVGANGRLQFQRFEYDWLGNTRLTDDDADGFYDRSLGDIGNGTAAAGPYQLKSADNEGATPGNREGALAIEYDAAGNLTSLNVRRRGVCLPTGSDCSQQFRYEWDEVNRLVKARRWDVPLTSMDTSGELNDHTVPATVAAVQLEYEYDAADQRVIKTATDTLLVKSHTAYIFESLEIRRAPYAPQGMPPGQSDYDLTDTTEVPYLFGNGVRLARVVAEDADVPGFGGAGLGGQLHVFLELGDNLGSTSVVLDQATSELVERSTYQAYGAAEDDYRPARWAEFREDYRFTGKEEDVEVGLTYFGFRFYASLLGRWLSADPPAVHGDYRELNAYAYVRGQPLRAVDVLGLAAAGDQQAQTERESTERESTDVSTLPDISGETVSADEIRSQTESADGLATVPAFRPAGGGPGGGARMGSRGGARGGSKAKPKRARPKSAGTGSAKKGAGGAFNRVAEGVTKKAKKAANKVRLPRSNGRWEGKPGNGKWYSNKRAVKKITKGKPIVFRNGKPDFTPWSKGEIRFKPGVLKGTKADFGHAHRRLKERFGFKTQKEAEKWLRKQGLTLHHKNLTTLQLIPTPLHANIPHAGSAAALRAAAKALKTGK